MTYDKNKAVERLVAAGCGTQIAMAIVQGIVEGIEACHVPSIAPQAFTTAVERTLAKITKAWKQARALGIIVDIESEKHE